jgi:hypothetical protein
MSYRVVVSGNSGDGLFYRVEDFDPQSNGFVKHLPNLTTAGSVEELKERLLAMADACDKPLLAVRTELVEVPLKRHLMRGPKPT